MLGNEFEIIYKKGKKLYCGTCNLKEIGRHMVYYVLFPFHNLTRVEE